MQHLTRQHNTITTMMMITMTARMRLWWFAWWMLAAARGCEGWLTVISTKHHPRQQQQQQQQHPRGTSAERRRCIRFPPTTTRHSSSSTATAAAAKVFYDPSTVSQTDLDKFAGALTTETSTSKKNKNGSANTITTAATTATTTTTHKVDEDQPNNSTRNSNSSSSNISPHAIDKLAQLTPSTNDPDQRLPEAPPLSYQKFLTLQEKRAVVQIRYSSDAGLKPYFLTVAKKLKTSHPDVIIERRILPKTPDSSSSLTEEPTFEILVDGKVVVGSTGKGGRPRKSKQLRQVDMQKERSIFVSMNELDIAICRARRKSRPASTVYGDAASKIM